MGSNNRFRLTACAMTFLLVACGRSYPDQSVVAPRAAPSGASCASMDGPRTVVTTDLGAECVGCSVSEADNAADGDAETAATLSVTASNMNGVSLRVTQPRVYPAGSKPGMIVVGGRAVGVGFGVVVRTYLHDALQEEAAAIEPSAEGLPHFMETTKSFDAVEMVFDGSSTTAKATFQILEACSDSSGLAGPVAPADDGSGRDRAPATVVADLSTGANPYHYVFRRPDWKQHPSTVIPGFPADAPALELTFGPDLVANQQQDRQKWLDMKPGVIYWIPGTNLLYVRTRYQDEAFPGADHETLPYATTNHGAETAGAIADACQDCYLLVVADPGGGFTYSLDFITTNALWVDVATSTQQSLDENSTAVVEIADAFVVTAAKGPLSEYASAAKRWAEAGKFYFIASGNTPSGLTGYPAPLPMTDRAVPPWFTVVGGAYAECRGSELMSGRPVEFVSEYEARVPANDSQDEYQDVSGTSFSTPFVAVHFARALKLIRQALGDTREPAYFWSGTPQDSPYLADGKLSRGELYDAFSQAAELFATDEYTGPCGYNGAPVSATPWLEMGWGYVGPDQAALVADMILGRRTAPAKPAEQKQYMDAYMGMREAAGSVTP